MKNIIQSLSDEEAARILGAVCRNIFDSGCKPVNPNAGMLEALSSQFSVSGTATVPSKGQLARQALLLLAEEPQYEEPIRSMASNPHWADASFAVDPVMITSVLTAAVVVLQTRLKITRDPQGRWTVEIDKQAASENLIKDFVKSIVGFWKKGN